MLLSLGANLLIVNNKGQTAVSIAVSHLEQATLDEMFRVEKEQLDRGGEFVDYRKTHSDGRRYGDLDPRFLHDKDDINFDMDAFVEMETYRKVHGKYSLPRSVRATTSKTRSAKRLQERTKMNMLRPGSVKGAKLELGRLKLKVVKKAEHDKVVKPKKEVVTIQGPTKEDIKQLGVLKVDDLLQNDVIVVNDLTGLMLLSKAIHETEVSLTLFFSLL